MSTENLFSFLNNSETPDLETIAASLGERKHKEHFLKKMYTIDTYWDKINGLNCQIAGIRKELLKSQ